MIRYSFTDIHNSKGHNNYSECVYKHKQVNIKLNQMCIGPYKRTHLYIWLSAFGTVNKVRLNLGATWEGGCSHFAAPAEVTAPKASSFEQVLGPKGGAIMTMLAHVLFNLLLEEIRCVGKTPIYRTAIPSWLP